MLRMASDTESNGYAKNLGRVAVVLLPILVSIIIWQAGTSYGSVRTAETIKAVVDVMAAHIALPGHPLAVQRLDQVEGRMQRLEVVVDDVTKRQAQRP